jgi:hypothetical protein
MPSVLKLNFLKNNKIRLRNQRKRMKLFYLLPEIMKRKKDEFAETR